MDEKGEPLHFRFIIFRCWKQSGLINCFTFQFKGIFHILCNLYFKRQFLIFRMCYSWLKWHAKVPFGLNSKKNSVFVVEMLLCFYVKISFKSARVAVWHPRRWILNAEYSHLRPEIIETLTPINTTKKRTANKSWKIS